MSLTVSRSDHVRLQAALEALLSHPQTGDLDGWRRQVNRTCKELLSADTVTFMLPVGQNPLFSEEIPASVLLQLRDRVAPLDARWGLRDRAVRLGVFDCRMLLGPHLQEYYRSDYYNEILRPARLHDALGIVVATSPGGSGLRSLAGLFFHHQSVRGSRFGHRGRRLLHLLEAAFRAAVRSLDPSRARENAREKVFRIVDYLGDALLLCDLHGRVVHRTPALDRLLAEDADGSRVEQEMLLLVETLQRRPGDWASSAPSGDTFSQDFCTRFAGYSLRANPLAVDEMGGDRFIAARLQRIAPSVNSLRKSFGLTPQEGAVTLLLAQGRSNGQIAVLLGISTHTARHHTERILQKLELHSRAYIPARLLQAVSSEHVGTVAHASSLEVR